jgi:glycosyltransferase involved in cell wall biosynthesis
MTAFVLVTPSYNLNKFIEQTIYSVVGQAGNFSIRYHVQDGGSSDGTLEILEKWKRLLSSEFFPKFCRDVSFTYSVESDSGMYDAINRGFKSVLQEQRPCVMSWINADDFLLPGALAAVSSYFEQNRSAQFVGGRGALVCIEGFMAEIGAIRGKSMAEIADGCFDGRSNGCIQQEGTFWRSELWERAGGLNASLKYAGDFDLWRRFAHIAEYHTLDTITGIHRKREGQLSSNMTAYYAEVDTLLDARSKIENMAPAEEKTFKFDLENKTWRSNSAPPQTWKAIRGLDISEGPFPEFKITSGRWMINQMAELSVWTNMASDCILSIEFRNPLSKQKITLDGNSFTKGRTEITEKIIISAPFRSKVGWNNFKLHIDTLTPGGHRHLGIFIEGVEISSTQTEAKPTQYAYWSKKLEGLFSRK